MNVDGGLEPIATKVIGGVIIGRIIHCVEKLISREKLTIGSLVGAMVGGAVGGYLGAKIK